MTPGGLTIGEGLRADGVLVHTASPLGTLWIPLRDDLTVFYGRNGSGKSRVLRAVSAALRGERIDDGHVTLVVSINRDSGGWDESLLVRLGRMIAGAVDLRRWFETDIGPAIDPDVFAELGVDWDDDYSDAFLRMVDAAQDGLERLAGKYGLRDGKCHSPRIGLVATGSASAPSWQPFLSVVPTDVEEYAASFEAPFDDAVWTRLSREGPSDGASALPSSLLVLRDGDRWSGAPLPVNVEALPATSSDESIDSGAIDARNAIACLEANEALRPGPDTLARLRRSILRSTGSLNMIEQADADSFEPVEDVVAWLDNVSDGASLVLRSLTGDPLGTLRAELRHPSAWLDQDPIQWFGTDPYGLELPVEQLGAGSRRWANLAISTALHTVSVVHPSILIVDEPERALHAAAQQQLASSFSATIESAEIGNVMVVAGIVATHSPAFLSLPDAALVHVSRNQGNRVALEAIDTTIGVEGLVAELGLTRSDALLTVRTFVFVEGEHDFAVLNALYRERLAERHAVLSVMGGAANVESQITARHLLAYSDAKLRVVLDHIGDEATGHWSAARTAYDQSDTDGARRALERLSRLRIREASWLYEAGIAALERGDLARVEVVGLDKTDIIQYLPVEQIVPGATSWEDLADEWKQAPRERRPPFKDWLRRTKGARINALTLSEIAERLIDRGDLDKVLEGL